MSAAMLAEGRTVLKNCPQISDVPYMADVLRGLGCDVELDGGTGIIDVPAEINHDADFDAVRQVRASVAVLGPLTARCHRARVALPCGGAIGSRRHALIQTGLYTLCATSRIEI